LQIKTEDITIPEFAQQIKPSATKAAVKEFLHDSPAPMQNKNESASLIQRFWQKLIGASTETKAAEPLRPATERTSSTDENQPNRNRNNRPGQGQNQERGRGRGRGQGRGKNPNPDQTPAAEQVHAPKPRPEQNSDTPRPNRPPRGQGRNVKRNLDPANLPAAKTEQLKNVAAEVSEFVATTAPELVSIDGSSVAETGDQPKRNNARRGPNRRRPRNPNYKKPETDGESSTSNEASDISNDEPRQVQARSYDNVFAERVERTERPEPQAPSQVSTENRDIEVQKPVITAAPAPKPVEVVKQETE
jgi:ribonuclease E